jgi:tellurite resistance protein
MTEPSHHSALLHVPVTIFASVMGLAGLGLAWRKANAVLGFPVEVSQVVLVIAALVFVAAMLTYGLKLIRFPQAVIAEFNHPIRSAFFSTFPIGVLLLAAGLHPFAPAPAFAMWAVAAVLQLVLTIRLIVRWMVHKQEITHVNPAWFIPIVGNIIVPILGVRLGQTEISWFFLSVGMLFWLPMLAIVLYRVIFHDALPPRLMPTLFILLPPPAIGYVSYVGLTGTVDPFAQVLVNGALFLTLVLLAKAKSFTGLPFAVSWWAFTFPLDAVALAAIEHSHFLPSGLWPLVGMIVLAMATLTVIVVSLRTVLAIAKGTLFLPE